MNTLFCTFFAGNVFLNLMNSLMNTNKKYIAHERETDFEKINERANSLI